MGLGALKLLCVDHLHDGEVLGKVLDVSVWYCCESGALAGAHHDNIMIHCLTTGRHVPSNATCRQTDRL